MYELGDKVFYYVTVMNEAYPQPAMPNGCEEGIVRGIYRLTKAGNEDAKRVRLLGSGTILREVIAAAELLKTFDVSSEVWSVTSFNELRREGLDVDRWNMLHPEEAPKKAYVSECLGDSVAPVIAATDYMKVYADQIRPYVSAPYRVLGTDGFGRSDTRQKLRRFFEVDRHFVVIAALTSLADQQVIARSVVRDAMQTFGIDADKANPRLV
jgi:pyruvate dehydrogenase E1 component